MDNGALVFIIIAEAIVIVWLASKLTQYQKFEHLLKSPGSTSSANSGNASSAVAELAQDGTAAAGIASRAVAGAVSGSTNEDEDLLDMPGVDPEANIEEAKRVQLVMARCRYAEFYLEQLDDDYELGQFQRIINSCKKTARNIEDPFFRASAMHPVIILLDKAEWGVERDELLAEVDDEFVKQRISDELSVTT